MIRRKKVDPSPYRLNPKESVTTQLGWADDVEIIKSGTYLNQELLDKGCAVRMAE